MGAIRKTRMRSRTYWVAAVIAGLSVIEASTGVLRTVLGEYAAAVVGLVAAVAMAVLRELTVAPISGSVGARREDDTLRKLLERR